MSFLAALGPLDGSDSFDDGANMEQSELQPLSRSSRYA
jgi:hypothetical protein